MTTWRTAIMTPGMKLSRLMESCRMVRVWPSVPNTSSWWATLPAGSGTPTYFATNAAGQIVAVNADGTDERVITSGSEPSISPDGTQLAFSRSGPSSIWVRDLRSGEERQLVALMGVRSPVWSPDGARLAILKGKQDPVLRIDPATRRPRWMLEDHFAIAVVEVASGVVQDIPSQTFSA